MNKTKKRHIKKQKKDSYDRPNWDELFMFEAYDAATRSSCRYLHTGAIIVSDKRMIASGYNGAPTEIENCLDRDCRKKKFGIDFDVKGTDTCRGKHAETNAMDQISRKDLKGTTMYTVYLPCSGCAKTIAGNEIKEVIYSVIYREPNSLTKEMFAEKGIKLRRLEIDIEKQFQRIRNIKNQDYNKKVR